ncbi:MAG: NAD(P)-binding domain-containing protein [bacterium]
MEERELLNDALFPMIGYQPDHSLLAGLHVEIDPETLIPAHDSKTMETNVPGCFLAGSIAAGKFNNKIFIENGRLHEKEIVNRIRSRSQSPSSLH